MDEPLLLFRAKKNIRRHAFYQQKFFQCIEASVFCLIGIRKRLIIIALSAVQTVQIIGIDPVEDGVNDDVGCFFGNSKVYQKIVQYDSGTGYPSY